MKKRLLPVFLLLLNITAQAQQDFFAITGKDSSKIAFNDFRSLDMGNGMQGQSIFGADSEAKVFSQNRRGVVTEDKNTSNNAQAHIIATLGYNSLDNTLVYIPLLSSNIYILNPQTKEIVLVENNAINVTESDVNSQMTRMSSGYDGNIYALSNAGNQFIQITKVNNLYIANNLGSVKDDINNGINSFTNIKTGFGGDMVGDTENNFYVFSASGNVFKIITPELRAVFVGKITGLPNNYPINGAAVNFDGKVIIGSEKGGVLYEINLETLQAMKLQGSLKLPVYDLASKYYVNFQDGLNTLSNIDVYPTRVVEGFITVKVNDRTVKGNIKVNMLDSVGRNVLSQTLFVKDGYLDEPVYLKNVKADSYFLNISDEAGRILLNKKILVTE
ncbi:T9SS C-terminal target domain-containing protein [Chryseobacterium sp.]|uniref:T9SS C-terminal target domain-containing protein n=1 Tax=Chryseobacterium sp. TaxID=1871047 RepID=UPI0025BFA2B3|nr:T9SS C-terminal target domain-containing protein [Chryseobacterium sp.]